LHFGEKYYLCVTKQNKKAMTSTIEIIKLIATETVKGTILIIKEQPVIGGGINQSKEENSIYEASIVYEF